MAIIDRRRIIFSDDMISRLKTRCGISNEHTDETWESHKTCYDDMKSEVDGKLASGHLTSSDLSRYKKMGYCLSLGILYFMTEDSDYYDELVYWAGEWADSGCYHTGWETFWMACVFDWFYSDISSTLKEDIKHTFMATCWYRYERRLDPSSTHGAWNDHFINEEVNSYMPAYLATAGETFTDCTVQNSGSYDGTVLSASTYNDEYFLEKFNSEYRDNMLEGLEQVAGDNGGCQDGCGIYSGILCWHIPWWLHLWKEAGMEDLLTNNSFSQNLSEYFMHNICPNRDIVCAYSDDNNADFLNAYLVFTGFAGIVGILQNGYAKWLVDEYTPDGATGTLWGHNQGMYLLYYDPDVTSISPSTSSLDDTFYADGLGMVLTRTGWTTDDMLFTFKCGPFYDGHSHVDNLNIQLFYKGELIIQSGYYPGDVTDAYLHYQNYYNRTIAANSVLIYDPNEDFLDYTVVRHNDGGQRIPLGTSKIVGGTTEYNRPHYYGDVVEGEEWYRGYIEKYVNTDDYVFAVGDSAAAYHTDKAKTVKRGIVRFKDRKVILVIDWVECSDSQPNLDKRVIFHTLDYPTVTGTVSSNNLNTYGGGDITYTSPTLIKFTDVNKTIEYEYYSDIAHAGGDGIAYIVPAFPENVTVKLIGGPNASDQHYTDDSYECYYNGNSHRPAGSDDTPTIGRWRAETQPTGSDVGQYNFFLHLIHVTDTDTDTPDTENITSIYGNMKGIVHKDSTNGDIVAMFHDTHDDFSGNEPFSYTVDTDNSSTHYIYDVAPSVDYKITIGSTTTTVTSSDDGVLKFTNSNTGSQTYTIKTSKGGNLEPPIPKINATATIYT